MIEDSGQHVLDCGVFTISIDLELAWGIRDRFTPKALPSLQLEREIVQRLLSVFSRYGISATWAIVGHLLRPRLEGPAETTAEAAPAASTPPVELATPLPDISIPLPEAPASITEKDFAAVEPPPPKETKKQAGGGG